VDEKNLDDLRKDIDNVDEKLMLLFEKRMQLSNQIGEIKLHTGKNILDIERERTVLENRSNMVRDPVAKEYALEFISYCMALSKRAQQRKVDTAHYENVQGIINEFFSEIKELAISEKCKIAYQGVPGSYSEEALLSYFGENISWENKLNFDRFDQVFDSVLKGEADYGVVPVENSSTGSIIDVIDLFVKKGCYICGEQIVRIEHNLLSTAQSNIDDIKDVYSHGQGFDQSRDFLDKHPDWRLTPYINTATSAKMVAALGDKTKAAIAGKRAAQIYGLNILAEGINTNLNNYTRFYVISAKPQKSVKSNVFSLLFTLPHASGTLTSVLECFSIRGINMLKIESRPAIREWEYNFLLDVEIEDCNPNIKNILVKAMERTGSFKILGHFKKDR